MGKICVLRLGHRKTRDQRITTHVFLVSRALGADEGVLAGDQDDSVIEGMRKVSEVWGGRFGVSYAKNWRLFLKERKRQGWKIVHLTMYGEDYEEKIGSVRNFDCVVVVGAGKVPKEMYSIADYNLSITNQPHSEIGAVALFLDRYFSNQKEKKIFEGRLKVVPSPCGKIVVRVKND